MTGEVIEQLWSTDRKRRASIVRRPDGLLLVEVDRLIPASAEFEEPEHWSPENGPVTLSDTMDRARELALSALVLTA